MHESGVPIAKVDFSEPTSTGSELEQHSEGLTSVALELDDVYELDENTTPENPLQTDLNTDSVETRQHTASPVWKEATQPAILVVRPMSLNICSSEKDIKRQQEISLTLTVKCCFIRDCHPSKF